MGSRGLQLLVVEDDSAISELLSTALRRRGDRVDAAHSIKDARRLLQRNDFDGLIADWTLGSETAAELVNYVAHHFPGLAARTLLISGDLSDERINQVARLHQLALLQKPFTMGELTDCVRKMFQSSGQNSAAEAATHN